MPDARRDQDARLGRLLDEQAALRRVATLVARGAGPEQTFSAVSDEVGRLFGAEVALARFEPDGSGMVVVGVTEGIPVVSIGTRWELEPFLASTAVYRTGRPARNDHTGHRDASGPVANSLRQMNFASTVAAPIVVEGRLWGTLTVNDQRDPLPPDTEERVAKFTELVGTAIANADSRALLRELAEEQAALRRVATMVAQESPPREVFATVAESVARLLGFELGQIFSYGPDAHATIVGSWGSLGSAYRIGSRFDLNGDSLSARIYKTALPARIDDYQRTTGSISAGARKAGVCSGVGSPILVDGHLWGALNVAGTRKGPVPDGAESRLAKFTELVATAISNVEARTQVQRLAEEQAALRRVATMVARAPASEQLFSTVAREVASVLDVPGVIVTRYDADGMALTLGEAFRPDLAGAERFLGIGVRMPRDPGSLAAQVYETHGPARIDDFSALSGTVGDLAREARLGSGCAGPIVVNGAVWGKMCVFSRKGTVLPAGTENRLNDFIELVATAIANYEVRAELSASEARARELADEQAALRRVATLVAHGVSPEEIFSAVSSEIGRLFNSPAYVGRFEPDGSGMVVVGASDGIRGISIGSRWELEDYMASAGVYRTGRPVRFERSDFEQASGPIAELLREIGAVATVGAPVIVEGRLWGFVTVTCLERLPADAEQRLEKFTELLATAIANAESRAELAASRARIITATDNARRRIERDLHDGAQQRLVTLAIALRRAEAKIPEGLEKLRGEYTRIADGLSTAVEELREISRGIHPSILSEGGLGPALKALGRRSAVRVKLNAGLEHRLPDHVEVAAYYTVSEALTNASKHAQATRVWVTLRAEDDKLLLSIRDDGVGGADASQGTGLTGLRDRIEALGGRVRIESPPGGGTLIEAEIPIVGPADRNGEPHEWLSEAMTPGPAH